MIESLYIHFPFCKKFCPYCDYPKALYTPQKVAAYIKCLFLEFDNLKIPEKSLKTIYFGGGTPNLIEIDDLIIIQSRIKPLIRDLNDYEWTMEVNPEFISEEYLIKIKELGINRLSIGIQTFNQTQLKKLGRMSVDLDLIETLKLVKKHFDNFSIDLIHGLPLDSILDIKNNLKIAHKLKVPHLSFYPLTVHEGTPYSKMGIKEQDEETFVKLTKLINKTLKRYGYIHYEVTNFALNQKYYGRHNLTYWKAQEYYGVGFGAHGYIGLQRYRHEDELSEYINNPNHYLYEEKEELQELKENYIMLNLRTRDGVVFSDYQKEFKVSFENEYLNKVKNKKLKNMLRITTNSISVKEKYLNILDYIISQIIF